MQKCEHEPDREPISRPEQKERINSVKQPKTEDQAFGNFAMFLFDVELVVQMLFFYIVAFLFECY